MDEKATVSVIIPIYNVENYLRQCLDSLVAQTYRDLEIILIDDGSPDNCGMICDEYAQRDNRIKVVHKENQGMNAARNDGIKIATGEWMAFVDSDDWCDFDYYEKFIDACNGKTCDIVLSGGRILEYANKTDVEMHFSDAFFYPEKSQIATLMGAITTYGCPWDKIFRSDFIKENELFFDVTCKTFEDVWFNYLAFSKARSVIGCPFAGYHNRVTATSATRSFNLNRINDTYDVVCKMQNYVQKNHFPEDSDEAIAVDRVAIVAFSSSLIACYLNEKNTKPHSEIAKEIKEVKELPYIKRAIWGPDNRYMTKRHILLKYISRLPWVWPIRLIYFLNDKIKRI